MTAAPCERPSSLRPRREAERGVEERIAVVPHKPRGHLPGKGLAELLRVHTDVGVGVTLTCRMRRRSWASTTRTKSTRPVIVGTVKKSMTTSEATWFRRIVRHVWDGGRRRRGISREIVRWETARPSFMSSP